MIRQYSTYFMPCIIFAAVLSNSAMMKVPALAHYDEEQFKPFLEKAIHEPIALCALFPLFSEPKDAIEQLELLDIMLSLRILPENKRRFIEMWAFTNKVPLKVMNKLDQTPRKQAIKKLQFKGHMQTPERAEVALFYILRLKDHLERAAMQKRA